MTCIYIVWIFLAQGTYLDAIAILTMYAVWLDS